MFVLAIDGKQLNHGIKSSRKIRKLQYSTTFILDRINSTVLIKSSINKNSKFCLYTVA